MSSKAAPEVLSQQLLLGVAEHLKLPLTQIARGAELGRLTGETDLTSLQTAADGALRLIDSYILGVRLVLEADSLPPEPVSVSAVLYDAGQQLDAMAKAYGIELELHVAGRYGPVMAHHEGLQAALVSLGMGLIEALPALEVPQLRLRLGTHRSRYGIVAGLYADSPIISSQALKQGRALQGRVRQPLSGVTHASGASIFVADSLLRAMQLKLQTSRHGRMYGLGTLLQPNNQLQLV